MILIKRLLAVSVFLLILLVSSTSSVLALGGWVDHKFELQRPDGTRMDLKGAKMHVYHKTQEGGFKHVNSFCAYPDKDSNIAKYVDEDNDPDEITLSSGFHCLTPQSCSNSDYGAPYLPNSFNSSESIYHTGNGDNAADASYRAFHDTNFTDALTGNVAYLAKMYKPGSIRGFDGAKWEMKLDWEDGSGVRKATQSEIDQLEKEQSAWGNIPGISGRQEWSEGEVYRDPAGENSLHARIIWVLKPPAAPAAEKPTASLVGKCANTTPGVPSYSYALSNIDLKGGTFKSSHLHLNVTKGAWTNEFKEQFGPPIYESTAANGIMSYSLIFTTTAPTNNTINWTVLPTEGIGNQPSNTKTVADLVKWVDAKKAAGVTIPFEIKTNLEAEKDGQTVLNDSITVASNGFKPKFVTNECGTPPPTTPPPTGGGTVPACVSIQMQNTDNQPITNPAGLKPGDRVKFMCGPVAGVNKYVFRVMLFNEQGGQAGTTPLSPESPNSNKSAIFTIPDQGGRFTAQCAICPDGTCQAYDIDNYTPGNNTGAGTTACPAQYSCVSQAGCLETATGNYACPVSGQVCCANRRRDE